MHPPAIGRQFTQMNAYFLVMNRKRCNLAQLIAEPTRVTSNSSTVLDLVITNCPEHFSVSGTLSPPSNCDHSVIFSSMNLSLTEVVRTKGTCGILITLMLQIRELSQLDWFSLCDDTNDIDATFPC